MRLQKQSIVIVFSAEVGKNAALYRVFGGKSESRKFLFNEFGGFLVKPVGESIFNSALAFSHE